MNFKFNWCSKNVCIFLCCTKGRIGALKRKNNIYSHCVWKSTIQVIPYLFYTYKYIHTICSCLFTYTLVRWALWHVMHYSKLKQYPYTQNNIIVFVYNHEIHIFEPRKNAMAISTSNGILIKSARHQSNGIVSPTN